MCGIIGVAGSIGKPELAVFQNMLWVDAIRGDDNTGICSIPRHRDKHWDTLKCIGGPQTLFDSKKFSNVVDTGKQLILGHNRSRTFGDTKIGNAHPFGFQKIIGAHNGTLKYPAMQRLKALGYDTETDSEQLYAHMDDYGIEETIKLLEGAWSLVWYDSRNRTVNFLRNEERPMCCVFTDDLKTMFWASEIAMLYLCLNRHQIKFGNEKWSKPFYPTVDTLYSYEIPRLLDETFDNIERKEMAAPKSFPIQPLGGNGMSTASHSTIPRRFDNESLLETRQRLMQQHRGQAVIPFPKKEDKDQSPFKDGSGGSSQQTNIVNHGLLRMSCLQDADRPFYYGYSKQVVYDRETFDLFIHKGCDNCGIKPLWGEPVKFLKNDTFICATCMINEKEDIALLATDLM